MAKAPPIYLDNAATTAVARDVADLIHECMCQDFGNPASAHWMGIRAEAHVHEATERLLAAIADARGNAGRIVWTSGGTESDALGILGSARAAPKRRRHVVIADVDHPAVRDNAHALSNEGFQVDSMRLDSEGVLDIEYACDLVNEDTAVATAMLVNNELGTIQPIAELCRELRSRNPDIHIHIDAVQALGKIPVDVAALDADSIAFSGHKIHGPKGIGALWLRRRRRIEPLWHGGGQQEGLRSGTLNVAGIAGMGLAVKLAVASMTETTKLWRQCRATLEAALAESVRLNSIHSQRAARSPHIVSASFQHTTAEPLLHMLESRNVLVSAGSACAERQRKPSPALQALGIPPHAGTLRFSFGRFTQHDEVVRATQALAATLDEFGAYPL